MCRQRNRRRLSVQSLESRKLMAGDAFAIDIGTVETVTDYSDAPYRSLHGGSGNDILIGGEGRDRLAATDGAMAEYGGGIFTITVTLRDDSDPV